METKFLDTPTVDSMLRDAGIVELVRRRRLLERCASHLVGRHPGHNDACICEGCRLIAEIRAMDQ